MILGLSVPAKLGFMKEKIVGFYDLFKGTFISPYTVYQMKLAENLKHVMVYVPFEQPVEYCLLIQM